MKVIYGIKKIKKFKKAVVALGVFDGVHLGHKNILEAAVKKARSTGGESVVLTFWPHPQKEESLYSLEHRLRLIGALGIDACIVINFNRRFAMVKAQDFIKNILFKKIGARYVYVGENFRFGRNAQGDCGTLEKLSAIYNFKVKIFRIIKINNRPVSSTHIRFLIKKGDLNAARRLLTRRVSVLGTVIRGIRLGRRLGFPTANIDPHHEVIPPKGVYAVRIIFGDEKFKGACYIGGRPTLKPRRPKTNIEVYVFNLNKNIYGKYLEIQFIKKLRDDKKFNSLAALAKQIKKDILAVRRLFFFH